MRAARGMKAHLIKTWGIHALHHGWTLDEVYAQAAKLRKLTVAQIKEWAQEQRAKEWRKG